MFESGHKKSEKRKKVKGGDAEEIDNFLGPWAKYVDEKSVAKPSEVKNLVLLLSFLHLLKHNTCPSLSLVLEYNFNLILIIYHCKDFFCPQQLL